MLVIGITSYTKCGKDYVAREVSKELVKHGYRVKSVAFATILKRIVADFLNIPSIAILDKEKDENMLYMFGNEVMSVRDILIKVGSVLVKTVSEDIFINKIVEQINSYENKYDAVIVTDVRFIREAKAIKDNFKHSIIVRIKTNLHTCRKTKADDEVDQIEVDMNFINVVDDVNKFKTNLQSYVSLLTGLIEKSKSS